MKLCKSVTNKSSIKSFNNLLEDFKKAHGNKYNYDKVVYVNNSTKVTIICPIHGEFEQAPKSHKRGIGCPNCGKELCNHTSRLTIKEFVKRSNEVHNNKYNYSLVNYKNSTTKITIICPIHGKFEQVPNSHINGHGCKKCSDYLNRDVRRGTYENFVIKSKQIHNDFYDYSKVNYINTETKVTITCPEHGDFKQTPHTHISKSAGCPKCAIYGFKFDVSAILYYIKIVKEDCTYYKLGVTNNTLKTRFKSDMQYITPLEVIKFSTGKEAYEVEQKLLEQYKDYKYEGKNILKYNGNTELFIKDIFYNKTLKDTLSN